MQAVPRVVLDTSILVAALRSDRGASNALLRQAWMRKVNLLATPALFLEYEEVIAREEHCRIHQLPPEKLQNYLIALASIVTPVRVHYRWRPQLPDADDEMVLETALNGRADYIVTRNIRDFLPAASRFRFGVLGPADILKEVSK